MSIKGTEIRACPMQLRYGVNACKPFSACPFHHWQEPNRAGKFLLCFSSQKCDQVMCKLFHPQGRLCDQFLGYLNSASKRSQFVPVPVPVPVLVMPQGPIQFNLHFHFPQAPAAPTRAPVVAAAKPAPVVAAPVVNSPNKKNSYKELFDGLDQATTAAIQEALDEEAIAEAVRIDALQRRA